jgi:hypothetical protein
LYWRAPSAGALAIPRAHAGSSRMSVDRLQRVVDALQRGEAPNRGDVKWFVGVAGLISELVMAFEGPDDSNNYRKLDASSGVQPATANGRPAIDDSDALAEIRMMMERGVKRSVAIATVAKRIGGNEENVRHRLRRKLKEGRTR